jgi:hypothetical protein
MNERSGKKKHTAKIPHPAPNFEYASADTTSTQRPSSLSVALTIPVVAPVIISFDA